MDDTTVEEEEREDDVTTDGQAYNTDTTRPDATRTELPETEDQRPRCYPQRMHRPPDHYGYS